MVRGILTWAASASRGVTAKIPVAHATIINRRIKTRRDSEWIERIASA